MLGDLAKAIRQALPHSASHRANRGFGRADQSWNCRRGEECSRRLGSLEAVAFEMPKRFRNIVDIDEWFAHIERSGT